MLTAFDMREETTPMVAFGADAEDDDLNLNSLTYKPPVPKPNETVYMERKRRITEGIKGVWYRFDEKILRPHFGGDRERMERLDSDASAGSIDRNGGAMDMTDWSSPSRGNFEMGRRNTSGGITNTPMRRSRMGEEMISLTACFDAELVDGRA